MVVFLSIIVTLLFVSNIFTIWLLSKYKTLLDSSYKNFDDLMQVLDKWKKVALNNKDVADQNSNTAQYWYQNSAALTQKLLQLDPTLAKQFKFPAKEELN